MMSSKYLLRSILSIPKYLRAASLCCSHCLECQVSGSLLFYVHSNKVSLNIWNNITVCSIKKLCYEKPRRVMHHPNFMKWVEKVNIENVPSI